MSHTPPPWGGPPPGYGPTGPAGPEGFGGPYGPPGGPVWPQPAPRKAGRWILVAAAVLLVVAAVAAFGIWQLTGGKPSNRNVVDLSKLDVGHYGTKPRPVPGPTTLEEGKYLEAFRLAEGIPNPYDIDPVLDHLSGGAFTDPKAAASAVSANGTPNIQPVLERHGMISAYLVKALSRPEAELVREKNGELLGIMLSSFPTEEAASHAAVEMDAADFAVNDQNQAAPIPGYPQAKAHFRPISPTIGATSAVGKLVASIAIRSDANPNVAFLTQRVQRTLDLLAPLAGKVAPRDVAALTSLPLDPDSMLSRLLVPEDQPKVSASFGTLGPRAAVFCADSQALADGLFAQAGIDRCAQTARSQLLRAKDEAAAAAILPKLVEAARAEFIDHDVAPPDGLTAAKCYARKAEGLPANSKLRFECYVSYGRYVALVASRDEKDVRQRAAAQYAILANSNK